MKHLNDSSRRFPREPQPVIRAVKVVRESRSGFDSDERLI